MVKPQIPALSARERQLVNIVTELGKATVRDVTERLPNAPSANAVRTTLGILVKKGHLKSTRRGRESVYQLTSSKSSSGRRALRELIRIFFGGSLKQAVVSYLTDPHARYTDEELDEIERVLDEIKSRRAHGE